MGQSQTSSMEDASSTMTDRVPPQPPSSQKSQHIHHLIHYARHNYQDNPTESLAALLQAMTLNSGPEAAHHTLQRLQSELGEDICHSVSSHHDRMERALAMIQELLNDETTELYRQGRQDILRQTMQDGTSVVCRRCKDVVASTRWQQHQQYWCRANTTTATTEEKEPTHDHESGGMDIG